mgnify:CR=1 FL=1
MAIELKRSLFIGLGGTGMKSVLKTKALYKEMFGNIPPVIGFVGMDTNKDEFQLIAQEFGVGFDANEQIQTEISHAGEMYRMNKENFEWMPSKNVGALQALSNNGAGQLRSNGRFIFENNYATIEKSIREAYNRVTSATNDGKGAWTLVNGPVQIYLVFSLSGGTGCGTFLNTAYLIKDMYGESCNLYAYAVMPGVFTDCGAFVGSNAYGAMLDTDYLMSSINDDNPYVMKNLDDKKVCYTKPFDLFYLIDNVNKYGTTYNSRDQIHTMIGQALLAVSGPMGSSIKGDLDNFKQFVNEGDMDCEDKKAWTLGHGLCEIMIDTKKLAEQFSLQASMNLVSAIIGANKDLEMTDSTITWINKNNLCEHEADQLLDSLFDFADLKQSVIASSRGSDAKIESDTWISEGEQEASKAIEANFDEKMSVIKKEIASKLSEIIASGDGLNGAKAFVNCLKTAFDIYAGEMREELVTLNKQQSGFTSEIADIISDWPRVFGIDGYKTRLQEAQRLLLTNKIDISRHVKASQFYAEIKEYLETMENKTDKAVEIFGGVNKKFSEIKMGLALKKNDNPFQIDLSNLVRINDNHTDNTVEKFIASLNGENILELSALQAIEVMQKVIDFTSSLEGADFNHVSVEELVLSMSTEEKKDLFKKAMEKAEILLDYQHHGFLNESRLYAYTYVSVPAGNNGLLAKDPAITETIASFKSKSNQYVPATSPTSIMIYRHKGLYPVFQVETIVKQKKEYDRKSDSKSFSFDTELEAVMNNIRFGFTPNQKRDGDVLEMWVKGLIYGFIRRNGQRYEVQSKAVSDNDAGNDYWAKLRGPEEGKGTEARHYAYEDFKSKKKDLKTKGDLLDMIRTKEREMGKAQVTKLYTEIQDCTAEEYVSKYSSANIEHRTIQTSLAYQKTKQVMDEEHTYRKEMLVSSIENI